MRRRCGTTILLTVYLASRLAVAPHVHALSEKILPDDHRVRPHVHVSWLDHGGREHTQDHEHSDDHEHGHVHDHGHTHERALAGDRRELSALQVTGHSDLPAQHFGSSQNTSDKGQNPHDGDAVYLPPDAGAPSTITASADPTGGLMIAWWVDVDVTLPRLAALGLAVGTAFGHQCSSGCPLYLTLRALRL